MYLLSYPLKQQYTKQKPFDKERFKCDALNFEWRDGICVRPNNVNADINVLKNEWSDHYYLYDASREN